MKVPTYLVAQNVHGPRFTTPLNSSVKITKLLILLLTLIFVRTTKERVLHNLQIFQNLLFCREYFFKSYFNTSIIWSTKGVITIKFRAKSNFNSGRITFSVSFYFEEGEKIFRIWVSIILDFCQKLEHFSFGFISNKIGASVQLIKNMKSIEHV